MSYKFKTVATFGGEAGRHLGGAFDWLLERRYIKTPQRIWTLIFTRNFQLYYLFDILTPQPPHKANFLPCIAFLSHVLVGIHFWTTGSVEWGFQQQHTLRPTCCQASAFGTLVQHRFAAWIQRCHRYFLKLREKYYWT